MMKNGVYLILIAFLGANFNIQDIQIRGLVTSQDWHKITKNGISLKTFFV